MVQHNDFLYLLKILLLLQAHDIWNRSTGIRSRAISIMRLIRYFRKTSYVGENYHVKTIPLSAWSGGFWS